MYDDEPHAPAAKLPKAGGMRNLAWGLAAFGVFLFAGAFAVGLTHAAMTELDRAGVLVAIPLPRAGGTPFIPPEAEPIVRVAVLLAPVIPAVVVAAGRVKPWVGLLLGAVLGGAAGAAEFGCDPSILGLRDAATIQAVWLAAGLTGGGLSAVRRRWKC